MTLAAAEAGVPGGNRPVSQQANGSHAKPARPGQDPAPPEPPPASRWRPPASKRPAPGVSDNPAAGHPEHSPARTTQARYQPGLKKGRMRRITGRYGAVARALAQLSAAQLRRSGRMTGQAQRHFP